MESREDILRSRFQCERCWMINLEGRLPQEEEDRVYVQCIRHQTGVSGRLPRSSGSDSGFSPNRS